MGQIERMVESLCQMDPEHAETYVANGESFIGKIQFFDRDLRAALNGVASRAFLVFHPAWGYFARDYGLEMLPVEVDGQEPSATELAEVLREARRRGVRAIFAQPEFGLSAAQTVAAELGVEVIPTSPLEEDWLHMMHCLASNLVRVLSEPEKPFPLDGPVEVE